MHDEANQALQRQWAMLRAIPRQPQRITVTGLMTVLHNNGFEPSRRTVERDLHEMSARFPLYVDDARRPNGWSWMKDATLEFMPRLSVSQCLALTLAQQHDHTVAIVRAYLDDLFGRSRGALPALAAAADPQVRWQRE